MKRICIRSLREDRDGDNSKIIIIFHNFRIRSKYRDEHNENNLDNEYRFNDNFYVLMRANEFQQIYCKNIFFIYFVSNQGLTSKSLAVVNANFSTASLSLSQSFQDPINLVRNKSI